MMFKLHFVNLLSFGSQNPTMVELVLTQTPKEGVGTAPSQEG